MIEGKLKFNEWDSWQPIFFDMDNGVVYFRNERRRICDGNGEVWLNVQEWIANRIKNGELIICDKLTPLKRIPRHDTMTDK